MDIGDEHGLLLREESVFVHLSICIDHDRIHGTIYLIKIIEELVEKQQK